MLRFRIKELIGRWEADNGKPLMLDDLAEKSGVSKQVLAKMSDHRGYVTASRHIEDLCRFFRVTPNQFIVFDPPLPKPNDPPGNERVKNEQLGNGQAEAEGAEEAENTDE